MKNFIRKWLNVPNSSDIHDSSEYVKINDVKKVVKEAIEEAFSPKPRLATDPAWNRSLWRKDPRGDIRGTLNNVVDDLIQPKVEVIVRDKMDSILQREDLLDDIVKRITNKQITRC